MDEIIKKKSVIETITPKGGVFNKWTTIEYLNSTVVTFMEGASFPIKSAPSPDALWATNIVKKTIVESIKLFPVSLFLKTLSKKSLSKLLESFTRMGMGVMEPYLYYKYLRGDNLNLSNTARGIGKVTDLFLIYYGIEQNLAHKTAELLAHIVEFDSFYRFKILDIMSEADIDKLTSNPRKEVQRLIEICYNREQIIPTYIRPKLKILSYLAWILEVPKVKKAFIQTFEITGLSLFETDEMDYYWILQRKDYHYLGLSPEERLKILKKKGWTEPTEFKHDESTI